MTRNPDQVPALPNAVSHGPKAILSRRLVLHLLAAGGLCPAWPALAKGSPRRIRWTDLIPNGLPYGEIIGRGFVDAEKDVWIPEFDTNGSALNTYLDGAYITLAGYMIPLELTADGVTEFVLVPYVGACIHTPPPPPNQLVFATSDVPWPQRNLWDAVLATGNLQAKMRHTDLAQVGYQLETTYIEDFKR